MNNASQKIVEKLQPNTLVIFGLGREGLSTYQFLRKFLPKEKVILIDDRSPLDLSAEWDTAKDDPLASFTSPEEYQHHLTGQHLLFVTPGIPPKHRLLKSAAKAHTQLHSNTQLFFDCIAAYNSTAQHPAITIAVTGTKGKSTTSSAIAHLLKSADLAVQLGGNIGVPPLELIIKDKQTHYYVLELSAHQLVSTTIKPDIAVLLNITPEHLDFYEDFQTYRDAKARITARQTKTDLLIFNPEYDDLVAIAASSAAKKITFAGQTEQYPQPKAYVSDESIYLEKTALIALDQLQVTGRHIVENLLPAVCIANSLDVSAPKIAEGLQSFKPLQHRLQVVHETIKGVTFIDDSLATTPEATIAAIDSFAEVPIILLAGGYERKQDFHLLAKRIVHSSVTHVLLFPTTGARLAAEISALDPTKKIHLEAVDSMSAAVSMAAEVAQPNTVVLLSPASASFGMFEDYADRSMQFIKAARKIR